MKDIKSILFSLIVICLLCSCSSSAGEKQVNTVILAGNVDGKFLPSDTSTTGRVSIANVGGAIKQRLAKQTNPVSLIQMGNTVGLDNEDDIEKLRIFVDCAREIGFEANLASNLEFSDTKELAAVRSDLGWDLVLTNVKPKEGVTPPFEFSPYYLSDPGGGRLIYFLNFIHGGYFNDHELLTEYYEWIPPQDWIKDFARKIRKMDIVVVYYQTFTPADLTLLFSEEEAQNIALVIVENSLFSKLSNREQRDDEYKDVNIIQVPRNLANLQFVDIYWDPITEKWKADNQLIPVGSSVPPDESVLEIIKSRTPKEG